jgi:hypothetical protein
LELNGTCQPVVYADDANLLGENVNITKKNTETLLDAGKEVYLGINAKKIKYMFTLITRLQDIITIYRLLINASKITQTSAAEWRTLLHIQKVLDSNLGTETTVLTEVFRGSPQFLQVSAG